MLVTVCREGDETEAGPQTTVWDVRTGQMLHVFEGRGVLSADGSQVLTNAGKLAHLWDIRDGHEIVRLEHAEPISAAVFSPDDKKIMTRSYSAITIWSTLDGQRLTTIRERRMYFEFPRWQLDRLRAEHLPEVILTVLKSLPDHIFTDDAQLWEFLAKQIGAELLQRYHDRFKDDLQKYEYGFQTALFSPDSRHVLTRCEMPDHDENTVRVWDAVSGQLLFLLEHDAPMATALFTPDGKYILTQKESALNVWDAEHGQPVTSIKETRVAFEVPWRHQLENDLPEDILDRIARLENQTFIGQAAFMNVLVAQIGQEQTERYKDLLLAQARTYHYSFKMIAGAPDSKRLLTLVRVTQDYWEPQSEDTLRLWDVQSGQLFAAFPHAAPVNAAAFSRDGRWLMTVSGRNVSLWQVNTAQLLLTLKHDFPVTSAAFSPDEKQILVTSAAFSPDEDAPLSREQAARVWNIFLPEQPLVVSARQLTSRTSLDVQPQYTELAIARAAVLKSYFWENLNRSFIIPAWHKVKQVLLPFRRLIRKPPDAIG